MLSCTNTPFLPPPCLSFCVGVCSCSCRHTLVYVDLEGRSTSGVISQVLLSYFLRQCLICLGNKGTGLAGQQHCVCLASWEHEHTLHLPFLLASGIPQVSCGRMNSLPVGRCHPPPTLFEAGTSCITWTGLELPHIPSCLHSFLLLGSQHVTMPECKFPFSSD